MHFFEHHNCHKMTCFICSVRTKVAQRNSFIAIQVSSLASASRGVQHEFIRVISFWLFWHQWGTLPGMNRVLPPTLFQSSSPTYIHAFCPSCQTPKPSKLTAHWFTHYIPFPGTLNNLSRHCFQVKLWISEWDLFVLKRILASQEAGQRSLFHQSQ